MPDLRVSGVLTVCQSISQPVAPPCRAARFHRTPSLQAIAALAIGLLGLAGRAADAACNCTCDALVPSSQQINASQMNESGAGPTHFVSAAGPLGVAREIRHGNLFPGNGMTITHVCIALQSPSGQPGEIANVQIYQPDPDPINMNLPGAMMYDQQFQVSPGFNNHQIVQLVTPQTMTANFWLVVAYPTAQPAIGHQGTRPRTQGNSAVFVHPPGFGTGWKYYDDIGGPGGTAGYLGNAPIIRPLNIGASGSVCPYGQQCCTTVCNLEPMCCVNWSPLCEQLALNNCFQGGCATCPANGIAEAEACNTDINGGCDTNGVFSTLNCDTTICGTLWRHSVTGALDSDWYRINVVDTDGSGMSFFTFNVESEVAVEVLLQNDACPLDPLYVIYTGQNVPACIPTVFGGAVPSPGSYRISVRPTGIVTGNCVQPHDYTLWVDVDDCGPIVPAPVNDDCSNATPLAPGTVSFDTSGATTDGPADACGFTGLPGQDADVWWRFVGHCHGVATLTLATQFDARLGIYLGGCPLPGVAPTVCGIVPAGGVATAPFTFNAGQVYYIRVGGVSGAQGTGQLSLTTTCNCLADINGDGVVDVNDMLAVIGSWGACPLPCPPTCPASINGDCVVNVNDLLAIVGAWGACP